MDAKGIELDNPEKQEGIKAGVADKECISNIYGTDYGWLQSEIEASLNFWKLIPKDPDEECWKNDICPSGDGVIF